MSSPDRALRYVFGPYELDLAKWRLRKYGVRLRLERKPLQLLLALLEQPGNLVKRNDLRCRLWGEDVFVDFENGLNVAVKKLRAALGDSAEAPVYVETIAGEGYRFTGSYWPAQTAKNCRRRKASSFPFLRTNQSRLWFSSPTGISGRVPH